MNKNTIEYLAYLLNKAHKEEGREKAIVFLGAGTSVSAGIPLTNVIVRHIKKKFRDNPIIKEFTHKGEADYYKLMGALTADERRDLFHFYVTRKRVKLNITNIYLAQLLKLGYVDYIVTVNFDDLILKACTLYNFLPPVYDISNIKTITTTDIRKNSVIYLHGQYFGQWLLNNPDELGKVEDEVLRLFNAIKTRRTWIVVGYSGNDGIFEKIKSLGSFSNDLFWVKNKFTEKDKDVTEFIETPNINAHRIEGYYADSFFLKLHSELSKLDKNLEVPEIISKPFTFVKSVLQSINEINDDDELNDNVKKMIISCNDRIDKAISEYEAEGTQENLKQRIVDAILKGNFNEELALSFEHEVAQKNYVDMSELSWYYNEWGNLLLELARYKNDEALFKESIDKFKKALNIDPKNPKIFNNWGNSLLGLARKQKNESLFKESFDKYKQASELNSKNANVFYNWGNSLLDLARLRSNENLYRECIEKYKLALELDPKNVSFLYNLGIAISDLASETENENLFVESLDIFKKASELDPKQAKIFNNWGVALSKLAKYRSNEDLYKESSDKFKKASELDPEDASNFYNWGIALSELANYKNDENLLKNSIEKYKIVLELDPKYTDAFTNLGTALLQLGKLLKDSKYFEDALKISERQYELEGDSYNMSCAYALLSDKENALKYLKESLDNNFVTIDYVKTDDDWETLRNDEDFTNLINHYKQNKQNERTT
ncbi:TPR end-of-group domain-containing protein [Chryseobacterium sp. HMWF035]|uniref:TPR end-of-group domain-containing protein n=3 Tax=unclassified Chryseobacterium TaxID=2593645 RepID=UPI000D567D0F|nr:hypothetical protein [Chryseobacterium sp. HMWF035]PVV61697.1 hypothetical protein DD829_01200 [Chryseobacterium sp. HMWF035]